MDENVRTYIDGIAPEHRPLFERVQRLILEEQPDVVVSISYGIPKFAVGRRRLYIGAWRHGVSLYGWPAGHDGGFVKRHPSLLSGKATIRLSPETAAEVSDEEIRALIALTLSG